MHIFGDLFIALTNGKELFGKVLVSDVFNTNDCLKASLVVEFDERLGEDKFLTHKDIEYIILNVDFMDTYFYGYVNIERTDNKIDEDLNDVYIEEDYSYGDISRFFISVDCLDSIMILDKKFALLGCSDMPNLKLETKYKNKLKRRDEIIKIK